MLDLEPVSGLQYTINIGARCTPFVKSMFEFLLYMYVDGNTNILLSSH